MRHTLSRNSAWPEPSIKETDPFSPFYTSNLYLLSENDSDVWLLSLSHKLFEMVGRAWILDLHNISDHFAFWTRSLSSLENILLIFWGKIQGVFLENSFWLECPTDRRTTSLTWIFYSLLRGTPLGHIFFAYAHMAIFGIIFNEKRPKIFTNAYSQPDRIKPVLVFDDFPKKILAKCDELESESNILP